MRVDSVGLYCGFLRDPLQETPLTWTVVPLAHSFKCPPQLQGFNKSSLLDPVHPPSLSRWHQASPPSPFPGLWEACCVWIYLIPQCTQIHSQARAVPALPLAFRLPGVCQIPIPKLQDTCKGLQKILLKSLWCWLRWRQCKCLPWPLVDEPDP